MKTLQRAVTRLEQQRDEESEAARWSRPTVIQRQPDESYQAYSERYHTIRAEAPRSALLVVIGSFATDDPAWPAGLEDQPASAGR